MKGFSVKDVFIRRNLPGDIWNLWLDDNGDGVGHPPNSLEDDGNLASITKIGKPNSDNLKLVPWILYLIGSPGEIRVYDSQNRVTGIVNGEVKEGIPASVSSIKDEAIILFDPSDSYHYEVVGTGEGAYTLEIASVRDKESTDFAALDIPIRVGVIHQYTIDWEALSKEEKGVTVEMDSNGDGIFEKTITVSTTLSGKDLEIACVKGDVNGDGKIQANDAILALRISAGLMTPTPQQSCAADMNEDGEVMANDAILILRKVAGLAAPDKQTVLNSGKSVKAILEEAHGVSGESIVVPVKVDNTDLLAGGDICITYDSTVLRAVDVISDDDILLVDNINEVAKVRIAFASSDKLNHNVLARVRFDILRDDTSPLKFESVEFYQRDADLMNVSKIDTKFSSWAIRPDHSALLQNFPNPFNPETWIPYQLKEGSEVSIRIFNVSGNLVRELRLGYKPAGLYISRDRSAYWNGRNEAGEFVSSGLYFYSIEAGEFIVTHKMIMLK